VTFRIHIIYGASHLPLYFSPPPSSHMILTQDTQLLNHEIHQTSSSSWRDIPNTVRTMSTLYDEYMFQMLKDEDNVVTTAFELVRIVKGFPLVRIINVTKWI